MVHQDRHVDNLHFFQKIQQRFADIEDRHLASAADSEPFFG
jgi:hypothetical protein